MGFDRLFATWAGERSHFAKEVIEQALAHQLKDKVDAAYFHGLYMEKRKALMAGLDDVLCEAADDC